MPTHQSIDIEESLLPSSSFSARPMKRPTNLFSELDYTKRIAIFIVLNIVATILTFGSVMRLFMSILTLNASGFVLAYTMGNILSLVAMVVLTGLQKQVEAITDPARRKISAVYLGSMGLCAILPLVSTGFISRLLVLGLVVVQMASYYVFTLSYFPRAKTVLAAVLGSASKMLAKNN